MPAQQSDIGAIGGHCHAQLPNASSVEGIDMHTAQYTDITVMKALSCTVHRQSDGRIGMHIAQYTDIRVMKALACTVHRYQSDKNVGMHCRGMHSTDNSSVTD